MVEIIYPNRLPDTYTADFKSLYPDAAYPSAGYVTGLSAIAFLASRSDWFASATMAYEALECATRDEIFASGVWIATQENLLHYFPETEGLLVAEKVLKFLIESEQVGAIAKPFGGACSQPVKAYAAADWSRTFERHMGLVLIPGHWDLKVDAAALRRAIPAPPPVVIKPRGAKFMNMAEKLAPIFARHHEWWSAIPDDPARARTIRAALASSASWRATPPDPKTIRAHWDHFVKTRK